MSVPKIHWAIERDSRGEPFELGDGLSELTQSVVADTVVVQ